MLAPVTYYVTFYQQILQSMLVSYKIFVIYYNDIRANIGVTAMLLLSSSIHSFKDLKKIPAINHMANNN